MSATDYVFMAVALAILVYLVVVVLRAGRSL
jgi:hypothetical protein